MLERMSPTTPIARIRPFAMLGLLAIVVATCGCSGGQEVTPTAIEQARQLWANSGIRDYELDWTASGAQNNHFYVTVAGGKVHKVESVRSDGQRFALKPADTRFYSVDGLFLTIADELAQLKTDHPFGKPAGTKIVMRFKPDPKLGYPQWYRRDVMGTSLALAIDVVKLVPKAPLEATH
jgi:Family of unknown function (DUF6174)